MISPGPNGATGAYPGPTITPEIEALHRDPPDEDKVYAEIGRTILAVQPTDGLFNVITLIVVPEKAFRVENLAVLDPNKRAKTLGKLKGHLVEKLKLPFDTVFLDALEKFIENRNALVHKASTIPGWDMKTPNGRIAAFIFLKNLQLQNILEDWAVGSVSAQ
ncbi:MAG: hypothetical protein WB586_06680 [Chthoniobacterales bacterium]